MEASIVEVVAYCLDNKNSTRFDFVRFTDKVKVEHGTKFAHVTELLSTTAASGRTVRFAVKDGAGEAVDYTVFNIFDEDQRCRSYVILFEKPFSEGEVDKMMMPLSTFGEDYLTLGLTYAPKANLVEIRLAVPESFPILSLQNGTPANLRTLDIALDQVSQVLNDEVISGKEYETRVSGQYGIERGYKHYGWKGGPCHRGSALRVIYRIQKVA